MANDISKLLQQWNEGDPTAVNELIPLVYPRLRAIAGSFYFDRSSDPTLQPTALVNELYLRLLRLERVNWQDREHLFAFAARAMRTILVDSMRARGSFKRGGGMNHVPLHEELPWVTLEHDAVVELNRALDELHDIDRASARLIELRFLLGCTAEEVADMQGTSRPQLTATFVWQRSGCFAASSLSEEYLRLFPSGLRYLYSTAGRATCG